MFLSTPSEFSFSTSSCDSNNLLSQDGKVTELCTQNGTLFSPDHTQGASLKHTTVFRLMSLKKGMQ